MTPEAECSHCGGAAGESPHELVISGIVAADAKVKVMTQNRRYCDGCYERLFEKPKQFWINRVFS